MNNRLYRNCYAVVLAGGTGTRLWPISREYLPKQVQKLVNNRTLLENTIERIAHLFPPERIFISTTKNYLSQVIPLLPSLPKENIIVEPSPRGKAAALTLAASVIYKRNKNAVILGLPSDHAVSEVKEFEETIKRTLNHILKNPENISLVGVRPTRADTELGYVKVKEQNVTASVHTVLEFIEKPNIETARGYVTSGKYYWSAAYYCFKAETFLAIYKKAAPKMLAAVERYLKDNDPAHFEQITDKRHEMEIIDPRRYPVTLIAGNFNWTDIGNWHTLHETLSKTRGLDVVVDGNRHVDIGSVDCLITSTAEGGKLIATIGLKNIVIVDTPDVLLVIDKDKSNHAKELVELLRERGLHKFL